MVVIYMGSVFYLVLVGQGIRLRRSLSGNLKDTVMMGAICMF